MSNRRVYKCSDCKDVFTLTGGNKCCPSCYSVYVKQEDPYEDDSGLDSGMEIEESPFKDD